MPTRWEKRGLVWGPGGFAPWARHSALQPTPIVLDDGNIRVYAGLRDDDGRGTIGFVELDGRDPSRVLRVSERPALAASDAGAFAVDGVIPAFAVPVDGQLRLYYTGFVQRRDVRFQAFTGLAVSDDGGETFSAVSDEPVLAPSEEGRLFRCVHSMRHEDGRWRVWYCVGDEFRAGRSKTLPVYDIRYLESLDGTSFPERGKVCIPIQGEEHRLGRPWVVHSDAGYEMYFGVSTESVPYRFAYATSPDGSRWTRDDAGALGLERSRAGWDSEMVAYPAVVATADRTYLFYNGNAYGRDGFGYAIKSS
jgi:predicted GH43/DUF377 family glycosyl hydrolase